MLPVDIFGNPSAFVFGFTQFTGNGGVPTGRLAQYIDLSANYKVCILLTAIVITVGTLCTVNNKS